MKDVRPIIAKNLAFFRKEKGLTQAELAEKLSYSDKAISRWEHGDTLPDINILYQLCEFYGITMDILLDDEKDKVEIVRGQNRQALVNRIMVVILLALTVWIAAVALFAYLIAVRNLYEWQIFIWAVPFTALSALYSGRALLGNVAKLVMHSVLIWSTALAIYLQLIPNNFWYIFLVGIPLQCVAAVWFVIKKTK